jgi:hypothetical protein
VRLGIRIFSRAPCIILSNTLLAVLMVAKARIPQSTATVWASASKITSWAGPHPIWVGNSCQAKFGDWLLLASASGNLPLRFRPISAVWAAAAQNRPGRNCHRTMNRHIWPLVIDRRLPCRWRAHLSTEPNFSSAVSLPETTRIARHTNPEIAALPPDRREAAAELEGAGPTSAPRAIRR